MTAITAREILRRVETGEGLGDGLEVRSSSGWPITVVLARDEGWRDRAMNSDAVALVVLAAERPTDWRSVMPEWRCADTLARPCPDGRVELRVVVAGTAEFTLNADGGS